MIKTLICSFFLGFAFKLLQLEIPCPPTLIGILGIIGLFLGYKVGELQ